ncbi:MAG: hypothetical protein J6K31_10520 [Parabacteroides sp.]|nr:hypothetical protein [Parabacteroides sp.]
MKPLPIYYILLLVAMANHAIATNPVSSINATFLTRHDSILTGQPNQHTIFRFFCRYTEELQKLSSKTQKQKIQSDDIIIHAGDLTSLSFINDSTALQIETRNKRHYIRLNNQGILFFEMSTPQSYELLAGKDKKELENGFIKEITDFNEPPVSQSDLSDLNITDSLSVYTENGQIFHIPEIAFKRYYRKNGHGYQLLVDPAFPEESVYNLFLSEQTPGQYTLQLKLRKYGFKKENFEVSLKKWIQFCEYTGCECYAGIEKIENGKIHAAIFAVNTTLQYNHVMYVAMPQELLARQEGNITGEVHVYIPTDNIKELIGEYKEKNKVYKINIKK